MSTPTNPTNPTNLIDVDDAGIRPDAVVAVFGNERSRGTEVVIDQPSL